MDQPLAENKISQEQADELNALAKQISLIRKNPTVITFKQGNNEWNEQLEINDDKLYCISNAFNKTTNAWYEDNKTLLSDLNLEQGASDEIFNLAKKLLKHQIDSLKQLENIAEQITDLVNKNPSIKFTHNNAEINIDHGKVFIQDTEQHGRKYFFSDLFEWGTNIDETLENYQNVLKTIKNKIQEDKKSVMKDVDENEQSSQDSEDDRYSDDFESDDEEQSDNPYPIDRIKHYLWQEFSSHSDYKQVTDNAETWHEFYNKKWNQYCDSGKLQNQTKAEALADLFTENEYLRRALIAQKKLNDPKSSDIKKERCKEKIKENIDLLKKFYNDKCQESKEDILQNLFEEEKIQKNIELLNNFYNNKSQKSKEESKVADPASKKDILQNLFEESKDKIAKFHEQNKADIKNESNDNITDKNKLNHIRFAGIVANMQHSIERANVHKDIAHETKDKQMKKHARRFIWAQSLSTKDVMALPENLQIKYAYYKYFFLEKMKMEYNKNKQDPALFITFIGNLHTNVQNFSSKLENKKKKKKVRRDVVKKQKKVKSVPRKELEQKKQEAKAAATKAALELAKLKKELKEEERKKEQEAKQNRQEVAEKLKKLKEAVNKAKKHELYNNIIDKNEGNKVWVKKNIDDPISTIENFLNNGNRKDGVKPNDKKDIDIYIGNINNHLQELNQHLQQEEDRKKLDDKAKQRALEQQKLQQEAKQKKEQELAKQKKEQEEAKQNKKEVAEKLNKLKEAVRDAKKHELYNDIIDKNQENKDWVKKNIDNPISTIENFLNNGNGKDGVTTADKTKALQIIEDANEELKRLTQHLQQQKNIDDRKKLADQENQRRIDKEVQLHQEMLQQQREEEERRRAMEEEQKKAEFEQEKQNISNLLGNLLWKRLRYEIEKGNLSQEKIENRTQWADFTEKVNDYIKRLDETQMTHNEHKGFLDAQKAITEGFSKWGKSKDGNNMNWINDESIKKILNNKEGNKQQIDEIIQTNPGKGSGYWRAKALYELEKAIPKLNSIAMAEIYKEQLQEKIKAMGTMPQKAKNAKREKDYDITKWKNLAEEQAEWGKKKKQLDKELLDVNRTIGKHHNKSRQSSRGSGVSSRGGRRVSVSKQNKRNGIAANRKFLTQQSFYQDDKNYQKFSPYTNNLASTMNKFTVSQVDHKKFEQAMRIFSTQNNKFM